MAASPSQSPRLRTPMERAPWPDLGTALVPKERYTSAGYARLEWERMWTRTWLLAGLESDLREPGDYLTFEIGSESILVVRQRDGGILARYNVCMHRGNRLREPGVGHAELFACGYHGWKYGLDGCLVEAVDAHTFPQGIARERLGLCPVRVDTWGGFVFVNLDPHAAPLREYLGPIPEHLDLYHFEEWRLSHDVCVEVDCNWKTSVDAFNEAYHVAATHPQTLEFTDDVNVPLDCYEKHTRMIFREAIASPRHPGHGTVTPLVGRYFLQGAGIDPATFVGGPEDARRAIAETIREQGPLLGCDFSELNDEQMVDDFHYTLFPNVTLNVHARFTWVFRHRPHPDDPNRMLFDFWQLVRTPGHAIPRPERERLRAREGASLAHIPGGDVLDQDLYNLPRIQAGMRSAAFPGLQLSSREIRIRHFHDVLARYVGS